MGYGKYWTCENCKQKSFDIFLNEWIHMPSLTIQSGKGIFLDFERAGWQDKDKYEQYKDLTFCSADCMLKWFAQKYKLNNPSAR